MAGLAPLDPPLIVVDIVADSLVLIVVLTIPCCSHHCLLERFFPLVAVLGRLVGLLLVVSVPRKDGAEE